MRNIFPATLVFIFHFTTLQAQLTPEQRIQDSVIGWWNNNQFDRFVKPSNEPEKKKRIQVCDSIVSWVKKSYTPVAGLGTFTRQIKSSVYGSLFEVWNVSYEKMWTDEKGRFKPVSEENTLFTVYANAVPGAESVSFINDSIHYYFTWPADGFIDENVKNDNCGNDVRKNKNTNRFLTKVNYNQNIVILAPGNQLPFQRVTYQEYLDRADMMMETNLLKEKQRIKEQWSNTEQQQQIFESKKEEFEKYKSYISGLRKKYSNVLKQPAVLHDAQLTIIGQFSGHTDPFQLSASEKQNEQFHYLYKVPDALQVQSKTASPLWIAFSFPYASPESGNKLFEMCKALTENINYDFIYNYFFNFEKVKGQKYSPSNQDKLEARLSVYRNKYKINSSTPETIATVQKPGGFYFHDDFSNANMGTLPLNWYYYKAGTTGFSITKLNGLNGNWMKLGYGRMITPDLLKYPLPADFTLEFDIATDKSFEDPYGDGGAVAVILNTNKKRADGTMLEGTKNETVLTLKFKAGREQDFNNNNYRGELFARINSTTKRNVEYYDEGLKFTTELKEFNDINNMIHVAIKIKSGIVSVFINNKLKATSREFKLMHNGACIDCGIPVDIQFNSLFFNNTTQNAKDIGIYISNITIKKD